MQTKSMALIIVVNTILLFYSDLTYLLLLNLLGLIVACLWFVFLTTLTVNGYKVKQHIYHSSFEIAINCALANLGIFIGFLIGVIYYA